MKCCLIVNFKNKSVEELMFWRIEILKNWSVEELRYWTIEVLMKWSVWFGNGEELKEWEDLESQRSKVMLKNWNVECWRHEVLKNYSAEDLEGWRIKVQKI